MTAGGSQTTIGIVSYCTVGLLEQCLDALTDHPGPVMVYDNASDDGSAEMVRRRFPSVVLHAGARNLGYGAAANRLLADATTPYLLLMNADARALPGSIEALESALDRSPRTAVVGPRIIDEVGHLQRSCRSFPTLGSYFVDQSGLRPVFDRFGLGDRQRRFDHHADRVVPWVLGAVLALRREAVQAVGGFDDGYFLYFEEIDLSRRLGSAGWATRFTADSVFRHVGGASSAGLRAETARIFHRSAARYFSIHAPDQARMFPAVALASLALGWLAALVRRRRNDWAMVRAVVSDRGAWMSPEVVSR